MDPIEAASYKAQRDAEERLRTQQATVPGLPAPKDPSWLTAQFNPTAKLPAPTTAPRPVVAKANGSAAPVLRPRAYDKQVSRTRYTQQETARELTIGGHHWKAVAEAYGVTGDETQIAIEVGIPLEHVQHILDRGIRRLGLPPVRDYFTNDAQVQLALEEFAPNLLNALNPELNLPEVQEAVTKRAIEEATVAMHTLETSARAGAMLEGWARAMQKLMEQGAFTTPKQVTPELISKFISALETHAKATERAVKLVRLTRGEPTDVVAHQVAALLVGCSLDELREADASGTIPSRVLSKFGAEAIDASFTRLPALNPGARGGGEESE